MPPCYRHWPFGCRFSLETVLLPVFGIQSTMGVIQSVGLSPAGSSHS
jgi:hypothetical protein